MKSNKFMHVKKKIGGNIVVLAFDFPNIVKSNIEEQISSN